MAKEKVKLPKVQPWRLPMELSMEVGSWSSSANRILVGCA